MTDFYQINILPRKLLLKRTLSCVLRETNLFYWCHQRISQSCLSKSVSMEIYKNSCSSKNNCFPCSWYYSWIYSTFETLLLKLFLTLFFILGESRLLTDASVSLLPQSIIFGLDDFYSQDDDDGKMFRNICWGKVGMLVKCQVFLVVTKWG